MTALGPVQRHVLLVLSTRGASTCTDWAAWWPLTSDQARGAIDRLGRRGLVDVAGFDGMARTFAITAAGEAWLASWLDGRDAEAEMEAAEA